jgi:hypothetical protein
LTLYLHNWLDPNAAALGVNNRSAMSGLQDIQGYNPVQPARYVDYMTALNGHSQEYHGSYVFNEGFDSPLLNLLNARYLIVPADIPPGRPDLLHLSQRYPTVYADAQVRVLENAAALPRAWLVHRAQQTTTQQALDLLASGTVDPRQSALLESAPPSLAVPTNLNADRADVALDKPDRLRVQTTSTTASLLMLSEMYYPAWHAYVDGQRVPVYAADGALRGVPVPAGTHTVELRYESTMLRLGIVISLGAYLLLATLLLALWQRRRPRMTNSSTHHLRKRIPHTEGHD